MDRFDQFLNEHLGTANKTYYPFYSDNADYNTNAKSYYDDLARKQHLFEILAKRIWEYDEELAKRFEEWDRNLEEFPENVEKLLIEWINDGTLEHLINVELFDTIVENKSSDNEFYKKEPIANLDLNFKDYEDLTKLSGVDVLYPQAFTMDEITKEIFVYFSPNETYGQRWVAVYDMETGEYKSCFGLGTAGWEGLVLKRESSCRYIYSLTDTYGELGKYEFELGQLPTNKTVLSPIAVHDFGNDGANNQFNYHHNTWIFEQKQPVVGFYSRYNYFNLYDDSFNYKGSIYTSTENVGYRQSAYANMEPKTQGIGLGRGKVLLPIGGNGKITSKTPYAYQGLKILTPNGELVDEALIDNRKMISKLMDLGYKCDRVENEQIFTSKNDNIYTLTVHNDPRNLTQGEGGIIIFKEFSTSARAIDFSDCSVVNPTLNYDMISTGSFPRNEKGMINPITKEYITSISDIVEFLKETSLPRFNFYSSAENITDLNGNIIEDGMEVVITNPNNNLMNMIYFGFEIDYYSIYEVDGELKQQKRYIKKEELNLELELPFTPYYEGYPLTIVKNGSGMVSLSGLITGGIDANLEQAITTIPSRYRPLVNSNFVCAINAGEGGGYCIVTVYTDGSIKQSFRSRVSGEIDLSSISYQGNREW